MQKENVSWECLAARRPSKQQRNLPVGLRVFRKIIIKTDRMPLAVAEKLAHRGSGKRRDVLHRGRLRGGRRNNDAVVESAVIGKCLYDLGDGRKLLPDRAVDADHVSAALIQYCVQNNRGLPGLTIADNQFALAAANGNHRIDGLDARLERLADRLAIDHARRQSLQWIAVIRAYG